MDDIILEMINGEESPGVIFFQTDYTHYQLAGALNSASEYDRLVVTTESMVEIAKEHYTHSDTPYPLCTFSDFKANPDLGKMNKGDEYRYRYTRMPEFKKLLICVPEGIHELGLIDPELIKISVVVVGLGESTVAVLTNNQTSVIGG